MGHEPVTISDDLRVIASGIYHDEDQLYAAADRLDELEADNAASAILIADQAHHVGQLEAAVNLARTEQLHQRIAELEAEVTSLNALLHRVVGRRP